MALKWSEVLKGWGRWLTVVAAVLAATLLVVTARPASSAETSSAGTTRYEAETMEFPSDAGHIFKDRTASAKKGLKISRNATASKEITTPSASRLVVRARGRQCDGAPKMVVEVDGERVMSRPVKSRSWKNYAADVEVPAGDHTVEVEFTNDLSKPSGCKRNLRVDKVDFVSSSESPPDPGSCATGQHQAEYYNNITLSGSPTSKQCEDSIDNDWGYTGSPSSGVGTDGFSARWTGKHDFEAGEYTFSATADDGMRVLVDGAPIIDEWKDQPETAYTATHAMTAGEHEVKVEYYENGGQAVAQVNWAKASSPEPPSGSPRQVFAHYMLCCAGISDTVEGYKEEIRIAQAAGLDGFALNLGGWSREPVFISRAERMYEAARQLDTGFKLFFSADMCCYLNDADIRDMVTKYYDHHNQFKYQGKTFLSTWVGEYQKFGYSSPAEGWQNAVLKPLADAGKPVYFLPHFYDKVDNLQADPGPHTDDEHPGPNAIKSMYDEFSFVDGLFYFSAIAQGQNGIGPAVNSNRYFAEVSRARGKAWMAGVSPNFSPHRDIHNRVAGDVSGGEGIQKLWKGIVADQPPFVQMVTWNDFGEQTYVGPAKSELASPPHAGTDARQFPHDAYRELSKYYIEWYKTGKEPAISNDKLFYFYRTHSKNAVASNDPLGLPDTWRYVKDSIQDKTYATVMLEEPATVKITSGGTTQSFDLPAGISNVSVPFKEGTQKVEAVRNGTKIAESTGALPISNSIEKYNFNYYSNFVEVP